MNQDYDVCLLRKIAGIGAIASNAGKVIRGLGTGVYRQGRALSGNGGLSGVVGKGMMNTGKFIRRNPGTAAGVITGAAGFGVGGAGYLAAGRSDNQNQYQ